MSRPNLESQPIGRGTRRAVLFGAVGAVSAAFLAGCGAPKEVILPSVTPAFNPESTQAIATNTVALPTGTATEIFPATLTALPATKIPTSIAPTTDAPRTTATPTRPATQAPTATEAPTKQPPPTATAVRPTDIATIIATSLPPTPARTPTTINTPIIPPELVQQFKDSGIPLHATNVYTVDVANSQAGKLVETSTLGIFKALFATPGVIGESQKVFTNAQEVDGVRDNGFSHYSLGGGFMGTQGEQGVSYHFDLPYSPNTRYEVFLRGIRKAGSTHVSPITWSKLTPNYALAEQLQIGDFVSERYLGQTLVDAFANTGGGNVQRVMLLYLDLNTGAAEGSLINNLKDPPTSFKNY